MQRTRGALSLLASEQFYARHQRRLYLILLLLALALRAAYFSDLRQTPYYQAPLLDARSYDEKALAIAGGDWLGKEIFYQDPLYPYVLAVFYTAFGHSYVPVLLFQMLAGALTCLALVPLAMRTFGHSEHRRKIAWLSGILGALCTPLVFYEGLLIKASLSFVLTVLHLWALLWLGDSSREGRQPRMRLAAALGTGMLLGLNLLLRGNYLLLAPLFAAWLAWRWLHESHGRAAVALLAYALGALLVLLPVTVRNYVVGQQWVLTTSQAGQNFYLGNNPHNDSGSYVAPPWLRPTPRYEQSDFRNRAREQTGRDLSASQTSRYFFGQALQWMGAHPWEALRLHLKKWQLWLAGAEVADNYDFAFVREHFAPSLGVPLATGYTLGFLGWSALLAGMGAGVRSDGLFAIPGHPNLLLMGLFLIIYSLSVTLFFVFSRYRLPVYPVLMILSAAMLVWLPGAVRRLGLKAWAPRLILVGLVGALVLRPAFDARWPQGAAGDAVEYYNLGRLLFESGRPEAGLAYFELARREPSASPRVLLDIAQNYARWPRMRAVARDIYERLLRQYPADQGLRARLRELSESAEGSAATETDPAAGRPANAGPHPR